MRVRVHHVVGQEGEEGLLRHPQVQQVCVLLLVPHEQGHRREKVQQKIENEVVLAQLSSLARPFALTALTDEISSFS